jgi:DNA invertase Pin-like site-specific DNA recombinase
MHPALDTTKYAIVYPRQSTAEQVENNVYSLERQLQLRHRAIADGFPDERVMVIQDDLGLSGRTITKRPGFTRALELIDQGEVSAIYVEDLTRLSRDERTIDQMLIADVCERADTRIFMGGSWYDMRDGGQRQSYKYQAVGAAEYWRGHLGKLQSARRQKALSGRAATVVPRGYQMKRDVGPRDPDRDRLIPHEPDAGFIRSLAAAVLDAGSFRGFYVQHSPLAWPDGRPLAYESMRKILTQPTYRGTYTWGDVVVPDAHEPLITPEQAARIDAMRELNGSTNRGRPAAGGGVLSGLLTCTDCGRKLASFKGGTGHAYRCHSKVPTADAGAYHLSVSVAKADGVVLAEMWSRLQDGLIEGAIARLKEAKAQTAEVLDLNDRGRRALQRKVDGLVQTLADPDLTPTARKPLMAALDDASKSLAALERQAVPTAHVDAELAAYQAHQADPAFLASLAGTWEDEPIQWRRAFLRRFVRQVEIQREKAGQMAIAVLWADGVTTRHAHKARVPMGPEELAVIKAALASPECPPTRRTAWLAEVLAAQGYARSEGVIAHALRRIAKLEAACSL